ncbi:MAG TPA: carbamoyltransferase HypF [Hyphomicrobiaceae bacterium]|nr:carbamoyltransferase HypF [Hyphomicrobiaceae bacterium]
MAELSKIVSCAIRVSGLVQGVGFRPVVWRLAHEEGLTGFVLNDGHGVAIEVTGLQEAIQRFCARICSEAPPLARIEHIETTPLDRTRPAPDTFIIGTSVEGHISTGIVPDWATCPACLAECFDPGDRRHGYAFTNCTHCGPRLSIVEALPYDRRKTTMAPFAMCPRCQHEFDDPRDRRFHAQPNACPVCGPQLWLEDHDGHRHADLPLRMAASLLHNDKVVAIKGIGGFHLACDATNANAVATLRKRKARDFKPLAVMVRNLTMARSLGDLSSQEEDMLGLGAAPIVLISLRPDAGLAPEVAPGQARVGMMLPYTPLHHLLLAELDRPLVMTSGNRSSEPQCISNEEAKARLAPIADAWLMHDREIANRLDDSVVRIDRHGPTFLRRARGFAPAPISLAGGFAAAPEVLAFGGELKSTFCFARAGAATLSQHLGDLEEPSTCGDFRKSLDLFRRLYALKPRLIAIDKHPDYASSTWGASLARQADVPTVGVQHHHAHMAAVMAENGIEPDSDKVLGVILDGTGLGDDGTIWGGEFLFGGYRSFERVGHLEAIALAGGAAAVREPWRNTYAHLRAAGLVDAQAIAGGREDLASAGLAWLGDKPVAMIDRMLAQGINAPLASSAGRLFDAVAGALNICRDRQDYEGQAAMLLEALATPCMATAEPYPTRIDDGASAILSFAPMWPVLLHDLSKDMAAGQIAARFHRTLIAALARGIEQLAHANGATVVALSGGVFQNRLLLDGVGAACEQLGLRVLRHRYVPANDGGLSLGQAAIAAATELV